MFKRKRLMSLVGLSAGAALVLSGCGSDKDPKADLRDSAENLFNSQSMKMTFSLDGTPESFAAVGGDGTSDVESDAQANMVLNSSMTLTVDQGKDKESTEDDLVGVSLNLDGLDAGEMVMADKIIYLKVDFDGLEEKFPSIGEDLSPLREASSMGAPYDTFEPLVNGEWVSIDMGEDSPLGSLLGSQPESTASPEQMEELKQAVTDAFSDVEVVRDDSRKEHLIATGNARTIYESLYPTLSGFYSGVGALAGGGTLPDPSEVPDRDVTVDFGVSDNTINNVSLDTAQFADEPKGEARINIDIEKDAKVEVPSDAPELDLAALYGSVPSY